MASIKVTPENFHILRKLLYREVDQVLKRAREYEFKDEEPFIFFELPIHKDYIELELIRGKLMATDIKNKEESEKPDKFT